MLGAGTTGSGEPAEAEVREGEISDDGHADGVAGPHWTWRDTVLTSGNQTKFGQSPQGGGLGLRQPLESL